MLTLKNINGLFRDDFHYLSIQNYRKYQNYSDINKKIFQSEKSSYTYDENIVSHIGNSSYSIDDDPKRFYEYYQKVDKNRARLKKIFAPYMDPIDCLIKDLSYIWLPGVEVARFHRKQMFVGIIRIIHKSSMIHAHQDLVKWSNPKAVNVNHIMKQFGMNFFVKTPNKGGHLMMWNKQISFNEFNELASGDFCIPVNKLPKPDLMIKPNQGMLLLLNSHYLHAIEAPVDSDRIAVSCFIGYQGEEKPLLIWT